MSLSARAFAAITRIGMAQLLRSVISIVTIVLLARLLDPADFGFMSMAGVVVGVVGLLKDLGISAAIVQRKELNAAFVSSAFWANVAIAAALTTLAAFIAPSVADFYREPRVAPLLLVLSLTLLISAMGTVHRMLLERALDFTRISVIEVLGSALGAVTALSLAFTGAGAWSLVGQALAVASVTTIALWVTSSWRPQFRIEWREIASVARYSINLNATQLLNYAARHADQIVLGRLLGAEQLGFYVVAYQLALAPVQMSAAVVGRVLFPVLSRVKDELEQVRTAAVRVTRAAALLLLPLSLGVALVAGPFVATAFGPAWEPVVVPATLLALAGMTHALLIAGPSLFKASGRTDLQFRLNVIRAVVTISAIVVGSRWGLPGVAFAYMMATFALAYPNLRFACGVAALPAWLVIKSVARPAVCTLVMAAGVFGLRMAMAPYLTTAQLTPLLIFAGMLFFGLAVVFLAPGEVRHLASLRRTAR